MLIRAEHKLNTIFSGMDWILNGSPLSDKHNPADLSNTNEEWNLRQLRNQFMLVIIENLNKQ